MRLLSNKSIKRRGKLESSAQSFFYVWESITIQLVFPSAARWLPKWLGKFSNPHSN